jgi:hypothetical protein
MAYKVDDRVIYVPRHAKGDTKHPDCERGVITSLGSGLIVFVRFGNDNNSKGCLENQLVPDVA